MVADLSQLDIATLRRRCDEKLHEFQVAEEQAKPHAELSALYKDYKALQQELNLRKLQGQA